MKKAFTMIELIFVIVILGILAAVVIPRFNATRTDAEVSKLANNIMQGASEIASYATSQAKTDSNLSKMSNGISFLVKTGDAVLDINNKKATVKFGSVSDCVTVQILTSATDDNLTVSFGDASGDTKCLQLQSAIDAGKYPMKLRGTNVTY
jgi:prepilin-type N-terminal cleavage/methylation domain-containing protein